MSEDGLIHSNQEKIDQSTPTQEVAPAGAETVQPEATEASMAVGGLKTHIAKLERAETRLEQKAERVEKSVGVRKNTARQVLIPGRPVDEEVIAEREDYPVVITSLTMENFPKEVERVDSKVSYGSVSSKNLRVEKKPKKDPDDSVDDQEKVFEVIEGLRPVTRSERRIARKVHSKSRKNLARASSTTNLISVYGRGRLDPTHEDYEEDLSSERLSRSEVRAIQRARKYYQKNYRTLDKNREKIKEVARGEGLVSKISEKRQQSISSKLKDIRTKKDALVTHINSTEPRRETQAKAQSTEEQNEAAPGIRWSTEHVLDTDVLRAEINRRVERAKRIGSQETSSELEKKFRVEVLNEQLEILPGPERVNFVAAFLAEFSDKKPRA
jgi:hypothetical protein